MYRLTVGLILVLLLMAGNAYAIERTEAQRYYDLAVSYIKSDLYEKGLDTLNQVAFLYPDSDVADDALYQLALIREQVGDGRLNIGQAQKLVAVQEELNRLGMVSREPGATIHNVLVLITAQLKGERVFDAAKESAIAQYILALDYLDTLTGRYPDSDRMEESKLAFARIVEKIETLTSVPDPKRPKSLFEQIFIVGCVLGVFIALTAIM